MPHDPTARAEALNDAFRHHSAHAVLERVLRDGDAGRQNIILNTKLRL